MSADANALSIDDAIDRLAAGRLVGVPTETEWGLAADARRPDAVARLFRFKGRATGQPVSVFVSGPEALAALGVALERDARLLADAFWPGPLTLVVPAPDRFAPGVRNAHGGLGLRCSTHPAARALTLAAEARGLGPLTATSLNRSGSPGAASRHAALRVVAEAGAEAPALLAGECLARPPSTVVDCTGPRPRLLREGEIAREALSAVIAAPIEAARPAPAARASR